VPAELLTAQQALSRAEHAFTDAGDSARTRDLAYIAQRRAEIANTSGALAADVRDKARAQQELGQIQATNQARMQVELSETRAELASERLVLANKQSELTSEQRARRAAERAAHAAMASLEKIASVKEEARGLVITLNGSVLFATGEASLLPIAQERLRQVAQALQDDPRGTILIEGHTDSIGSPATNEELSKKRADAVRGFLLAQGLPAERVRAVGLGSRRPIAENRTPEGRANNRRVEIVIEHERPSAAP
jgi:outer membrane protein OmpA-like peptidoglycan-associated protein